MKHFNLLNNFRWFATIILLITLSVGQMWGACNTYTLGWGAASGSNYTNFTATSGSVTNLLSFSTAANSGSAPAYNANNKQLRLYFSSNQKGGSITITPVDGVTITGFVMATATNPSVKYTVDGGTATSVSRSSGSYTVTNIAATSSLKIQNVNITNTQLQISTIQISYTYEPTSLTNGTIGSSTAHLSWSDSHSVGHFDVYRSTSNNAPGINTTPTVSNTTNTYVDLTSLESATTYNWWVRSNNSCKSAWIKGTSFTTSEAAACSADPTVGNASLNGSFNLTTVGVQCASITPGTNCSVASGDYGFIWYERDGTKKEIGGSGVTKVAVTSGAYSSGSFSANLTKSSFELGTRYSVRAFATNGKPATVYSDTITFQPRSVTFNLNGHGSSTPTTQYVNNGDLATDPSYSESVTGYAFGGWYDNADWTQGTQWNFGTSTVSGENKTLYAKWTPNNYTINFDKDLTPTSAGTASIAVTFDDDNNLDGTPAITSPTKTGWTFAGYYTAKNGGGTQIIDASGNVIASAGGGSTYTDASKNWKYADDITLYAKWTCTVTWSVNGATNVYEAQTLTYNGTSTKVASVPGPPSPASYCGDKFVGWTTEANVSQDNDTGLNLFTDVAGSPDLKAVGNQTFYAVFADYDE